MGGIFPSIGLRFTIYAIPPSAFGISYLIFKTADIAQRIFYKQFKYIKIIIIVLLTILILYPNIKHIVKYKVPPVINKDEVIVLHKLDTKSKETDYTISWWDYGYLIQYYANTFNLVDGGRNYGKLLFPVSFILTKDQISGANMARLAVEYNEYNYKEPRNSLLKMMKDYHYKNIYNFLSSLKNKNFKLPQKTRDIFLYLPFRMIETFNSIIPFSNIDFKSGKIIANPYFYASWYIVDKGKFIDLGKGVKISKEDGTAIINGKKFPLHSFITTEYDNNMVLRIKKQLIYPNGRMYGIFMKTYKVFLLMDKKVFNSLYIQLFVLDNFDKDFYEPIIISPWAKVYKLKR